MTPHTEAELRGDLELLNRTVAELVGYQSKEIQGKRFWNKPGTDWWLDLPRFAASLDACRTFEAGLTEEQQDKYQGILMRIAHHRRRYVWQLDPPDHCIALCHLRNIIIPTTDAFRESVKTACDKLGEASRRGEL